VDDALGALRVDVGESILHWFDSDGPKGHEFPWCDCIRTGRDTAG